MESSASSTLPGPEAEARHATIVKCDLVGSTRARKGLDLEGQLEFQRRFEQTVVDVADRHAAHIAGFEGDGALIAFGLPDAREDDAERAIRMGLDLIAAVRSAELLPNARSQVRVGVASGLIAVVKRPMTAHGEYFAGTTIDLAERLRARADPDELVIADETKRLAGGYFVYDDLGVVPCKGFDEPVRAWRVVDRAPSISRFEAQRFDPSRREIVGRGDALALLSEAWDSARERRGRAICLRGEAGIGKSRLARAAIDRAIQDDAALLRIDCAPSAMNTPLFPIGLMLHEAAGVAAQAPPDEKRLAVEKLLQQRLSATEATDAVTYLRPLFGGGDASVPADVGPDAFRERTITTLAGIFDSLSTDRTLLLVCEDLHWADDSTVSLMARAAGMVADRAGLIILTSRPSADLSAFESTPLTIVDLRPLDADASADLVRSVAKGETIPDALVRKIVERCEGVPLMLEEVTRNALEESTQADDVAPASAVTWNVPPALQIIVQSRINRHVRLAPLVQAAAVLGREFPTSLLRRILPGDWNVSEAVELLRQEGLFAGPSEASPEWVRFRHGMICDAAYNTLLGRDKRRLHSEAADLLAGEYVGTPYAAPDIVARHLARAGRYVEAIRTRLLATGSTAARGAYVETEGHCEAALDLLKEVADPQQRTSLQFRLLVQLGVAATGRRGYGAPAAEDAYRRAYAVCGDDADAETLYPIIRGLAAVNFMRGELAPAYELSTQGLELAERSRRPEFRLDALSMLSYTTMYFGRLADCKTVIDDCLVLYGAAHGETLTYPVPQDAMTAVLAIRPTIQWLLGDVAGAEESVAAGLAHIEQLGREYDRALMYSWIAGYRYTRRQWAEAIRYGAMSMTIGERNGYAELYGTGAIMMLLAQCAASPDPTALAHALATYAEFQRRGVRLNASYFLGGLARGQAQVGDIATAKLTIAEAFEAAAASRETRMYADLLILRAEIEPGNPETASLLADAMARATQDGAATTALRAAALLALRARPDDASVGRAQAALDALDGRATTPPDREWMTSQLAALQDRLAASSQPVARG